MGKWAKTFLYVIGFSIIMFFISIAIFLFQGREDWLMGSFYYAIGFGTGVFIVKAIINTVSIVHNKLQKNNR